MKSREEVKGSGGAGIWELRAEGSEYVGVWSGGGIENPRLGLWPRGLLYGRHYRTWVGRPAVRGVTGQVKAA